MSVEQKASVNRASIDSDSSDEYDLKQSSHLNISVFEAPEFDFVGDLGMKRRTTHLEIA